MNPSLLTDWESLRRFAGKPALLRRRAFLGFGGSLNLDTLVAVSSVVSRLGDTTAAEWRRSVAEACLLGNLLGEMQRESVPPEIMAWCPFGNQERGPALGELLDTAGAVAVFPLDTSVGGGLEPELGHVWVMAGHATPYIATSDWQRPTAFSGDSYELALELARRAAGACGAEAGFARDALATGWIVTGQLKGEKVDRIEVGNKILLPIHRDWIFPRANSNEIPANISYRLVSTVDDAWGLVTGRSVVELENFVLGTPPCPVLFSYVSKAIRPVLASVLLTRARRVFLLHSNNETEAKKPAETIHQVLSGLPQEVWGRDADPELIPLAELRVDSLEKQLGELLNTWGCPGMLFHATTGHKLMFVAAIQAARMDGRFPLIYREAETIDLAGHYKFDALRWRGSELSMHSGIGPETPGVNWGYLRDKKFELEAADTIREKLLAPRLSAADSTGSPTAQRLSS